METGLIRIATKAKQDRKRKFTSLAHHLTPELLEKSLYSMRRSSAAGVDGQSVNGARASFKVWSDELINQVHRKGYRPPPVKRVYIPKPGKETLRPIGVPTVQDRVLQRATAQILDQIYEQDFLPCSFGGRPGVSAHSAISTLKYTISSTKVGWVYEADLKAFFCSLNHGWLLRFVEHRIGDPRILTLIRRWLKAGVMEQGIKHESETGTPQGGSISVILSNIYLHYALDLWFEKIVKPRLKGEAYLVRYIDDFVIGFQLKEDAIRFENALKKRLGKFGLQLEPSKTQLIRFGKYVKRDCAKMGLKPPIFEFLGFTFYGFHFRAGNYAVGLKTSRRKLNQTMRALKEKMFKYRHIPLRDQCKTINAHLRGFYQYFGVPFNSRSLARLYRYAALTWRKVLSSRSQSGRLNWEKFNRILKSYPLERGKVKYTHLSFQYVGQLQTNS